MWRSQKIESIRSGTYEFPNVPTFEPYVTNITNISSEMEPINKIRRYDHAGPDDFFHTLNYIREVYKKIGS